MTVTAIVSIAVISTVHDVAAISNIVVAVIISLL